MPGRTGLPGIRLPGDADVWRVRQHVDPADRSRPLRALEQEVGLAGRGHRDPGAGRRLAVLHLQARIRLDRRRSWREQRRVARPRSRARGGEGRRGADQKARSGHAILRNQRPERITAGKMNASASPVAAAVTSCCWCSCTWWEPRSLKTASSAAGVRRQRVLAAGRDRDALQGRAVNRDGNRVALVEPPGQDLALLDGAVRRCRARSSRRGRSNGVRGCVAAAIDVVPCWFCFPSERSTTAAGGCGAPGRSGPTVRTATWTARSRAPPICVPASLALVGSDSATSFRS